MTWKNESARHSLASRGIRTRAIINPIASPRWYQERYYGEGTYKGKRPYLGSGLENVDQQEIVDWVKDFVILMNQIAEEEGDELDVNLQSIYLVGSRVSGFYTEESDIDIVIRFKDISVKEQMEKIDKMDKYLPDAWMMMGHDKEWLVKSSDEDDLIKVDIASWGWTPPEESSPYLKIWEAPE